MEHSVNLTPLTETKVLEGALLLPNKRTQNESFGSVPCSSTFVTNRPNEIWQITTQHSYTMHFLQILDSTQVKLLHIPVLLVQGWPLSRICIIVANQRCVGLEFGGESLVLNACRIDRVQKVDCVGMVPCDLPNPGV